MSNPNDEKIIEDAVNAFFSSIQATIDPKAELDLGGWAGINYDGHPDMKELEEIAGRVLAAHRVAVAESDAELAAAERAFAELAAAADAARSVDTLVEAAHGLELAESCARAALAAAQDGRPEVDVIAKVKEARRMALAALINLNV